MTGHVLLILMGDLHFPKQRKRKSGLGVGTERRVCCGKGLRGVEGEEIAKDQDVK